ncbi:hypothetical protein R3P38DRAFT_3315461 [Favolaschia claudopus]|uniref:Uncharacterized protein n=1 Tax=Favolaschia claudopus TaxID=2862362 RepID=A0AAW0BMN8_9AGAR
MDRIDETQETIARIRMNIDNYDKSLEAHDGDNTVDETPVDAQNSAHWAFGAPVPGHLLNSHALQELNRESPLFRDFDYRLRQFISESFPDEHIEFEDTIMIRRFKCVYLEYQSLEDWRGARDILRFNPYFQKEARYDSVIVNMTDPGLRFARPRVLLRCTLPNGRKIDVALVRITRWTGCQIRDESKKDSLLSMEHAVRGALMAPVSGASNKP